MRNAQATNHATAFPSRSQLCKGARDGRTTSSHSPRTAAAIDAQALPQKANRRAASARCGWSGAPLRAIRDASSSAAGAAGHRTGHPGDPAGFRLIIDRGFASGGDPADIGRWFEYLLMIVPCWRSARRCGSISVSWLGERVVADIRLAVQPQPAAPLAQLLRGKQPEGNLLADDRRYRASSSRSSARRSRWRCAT